MKTVGIIGGSGFIGSYVTRKFLNGDYRVRVSATDLSKPEKYQHLRDLGHADCLDIVPMNVEDKEALQSFMQGCQIVIHGGTPFQLDVEDPQRDLMDPTIKGTENFLALAAQIEGLEKVVFIASVAAHNTDFPRPVPGRSPDHVYTEMDEPYVSDQSIPYTQAKYYADQAVRRYLSENPDPGFEVVTICPTLVAGPALSQREDSVSQGFQFLVKNEIAPDDFFKAMYEADVEWAVVDVLDVAESIYQAATINGLHGKNYLVTGDSWKMSDMTRILNNESPRNAARMVYSNALAENDLGMSFNSGAVPLQRFANS